MGLLVTIMALISPIWVPMLMTGLYAFGIRSWLSSRLPKQLILMDELYWCVYVVLWLCAVVVFVKQIFGFDIRPLYQWLLLAGLGVPMLFAMAGVLFLSLMATDSW